ncbi:HAD hydrolase-like protein [Paradesertivirga mongoliensis]|uniref:HAD hydrolase-like protein n=1 Tax=Paradesertivirga mongoliensis TaxID=2100740 RepID=A0ABW4ZL12_9SPHI|nr:HAD hydrolase-like protein [Pedobacter mongoliensis]
MTYAELPAEKKAFIFELDDVLYPKKDYDLQVYYLFATFLEYQEAFPPANDLVAFMKKVYENHGPDRIFDKAREVYAFDEKYRENFQRLHSEAKLPLKLLLYKDVLSLLQDIVVDRKQIFIVTGGNPLQQLNKIKHTEWHGLEQFLKVYFADEIGPKPNPEVLQHLMQENDLQPHDLLIVGSSSTDEIFASTVGIDYLAVAEFIQQ